MFFKSADLSQRQSLIMNPPNPDYSSMAFQGWRENGVLHLPDPSPSKVSPEPEIKYRLRRPRSRPSSSQSDQTKQSNKQLSRRRLETQSAPRLVLPRDYSMALMANRLPSLLEEWKRRSRSNQEQSQLLIEYTVNDALSTAINTTLSKELEKLSVHFVEFTLFMNLPPELRLKIWFYALPRERLVEVILDKLEPLELFSSSAVRSPTPVPAILQVCSESRVEALKHYSLMFSSRWGVRPARVYFDPSIDVLFMNCHRFPKLGFLDLLTLFDRTHRSITDMEKVAALCFCNGIAKRLGYLNRHGSLRTHFQIGLPLLERLIITEHGTQCLKQARLLPPSLEASPTFLEPRELDAFESIFGINAEFGIVKEEWSMDECESCAEVKDTARN
ncbi:uncharacterized protein LY89DRAFT_715435 [Mollisia scopiformis]|uniref:2EXR domain-containing protein n=1 Tax=Mollisia scopiformis TaxID=149040 RepID=A0A194XM57_MOLSC|nr:uncharacterized protein LY89DRAFT_715435 [Mollisia scopiformis]KUJ21169.1 hypothetical protein LY89DRAFT_715435 [Mollisia scopiformis]